MCIQIRFVSTEKNYAHRLACILLFLHYISDLPNSSKLLNVRMYAADTTLYCCMESMYIVHIIASINLLLLITIIIIITITIITITIITIIITIIIIIIIIIMFIKIITYSDISHSLSLCYVDTICIMFNSSFENYIHNVCNP